MDWRFVVMQNINSPKKTGFGVAGWLNVIGLMALGNMLVMPCGSAGGTKKSVAFRVGGGEGPAAAGNQAGMLS